MLILEPGPGFIRWYRSRPSGASSGEILPASESSGSILSALPPGSTDGAAVIGFVLPDDMAPLERPVMEVSADLVKTLPDMGSGWMGGSELIKKLTDGEVESIPGARWFFLSESAFFNDLPERANLFALPSPLREKYPRRGRGGLSHAWLYQAAGSPCRMVSIHLEDHPSVAAIENGVAVETSAGYTPLAGIPSFTGCGDIDPTIVIELLREGMNPADVRTLLAYQSGFQVFSQKASSLGETAAQEGLPRSMLLGALLKAAGAALSAMGGADVIIAASDGSAGWAEVLPALRLGLEMFNNGRGVAAEFREVVIRREDILFDTLKSYT